MTMKKKILTTLSVVLILGLAALGILAYLQDEDSDVNVMTLGNVQIEQIEQEWKNGELVDFTQAKPLYPYVGTLGWKGGVNNSSTLAEKAYRQFAMNNVVDKYVSVKNTGKSEAYVRTIFAFEMGKYDNIEDFYYKVIGTSINAVDGDEFAFLGKWVWENKYVAQIDGKNYMIWEAVHNDPLAVGSTTIPSLLQVYMNKDCGNEEVKKVDGNGNGTYDILVLSQAVQAEGFADAETALDTAFGEATEANVQAWFAGDEFEVPEVFSSYDSYVDYAYTGGNFVIADNFSSDGWLRFRPGTDTKFDLNGKTITAENKEQALFWAEEGGTTHLTGEGTIIMGKGFSATDTNSEIIIDGGSYLFEDCSDKYHMYTQNSAKTIINGGKFITSDPDAAIAYCINGFIEINGGFFQNTANPSQALLNMGNNLAYVNNQKITLSGGTFVNWNPMNSAFARPWTNPNIPALIVLADGYEMTSETQSNGDVWYTVVPK